MREEVAPHLAWSVVWMQGPLFSRIILKKAKDGNVGGRAGFNDRSEKSSVEAPNG